MERLYVNLNKVSVKSPHDLAIPVNDMSNAIVTLANVTEAMAQVMLKSKGTLSGHQYDLACDSARDMSKALIQANEDMFDIQRQIYELEVKVETFDRIAKEAVPPKKTEIRTIDLQSDQVFEFVREDYVNLSTALGNYVSICDTTGQVLKRDADAVGSYWHDPQYENFVKYIDEIRTFIKSNAKLLQEYKEQLDIDITNM